jgi:hypothetical protein
MKLNLEIHSAPEKKKSSLWANYSMINKYFLEVYTSLERLLSLPSYDTKNMINGSCMTVTIWSGTARNSFVQNYWVAVAQVCCVTFSREEWPSCNEGQKNNGTGSCGQRWWTCDRTLNFIFRQAQKWSEKNIKHIDFCKYIFVPYCNVFIRVHLTFIYFEQMSMCHTN